MEQMCYGLDEWGQAAGGSAQAPSRWCWRDRGTAVPPPPEAGTWARSSSLPAGGRRFSR